MSIDEAQCQGRQYVYPFAPFLSLVLPRHLFESLPLDMMQLATFDWDVFFLSTHS